MNQVAELHKRAMDLYEGIFLERQRNPVASGDGSLPERLRRAYQLEREAALLLRDEWGSEPTRSVLFRSAASLGIQCGEYREAERLIALGLSGDTPDEIASELRALWAQNIPHLTTKS